MIIAVEINDTKKIRVIVNAADRTKEIQAGVRACVHLIADVVSFISASYRARRYP